MTINNIIVLLIAHFLGDFVFQSNYMAINKSKSFTALFDHVLVYSFILALFAYFLVGLNKDYFMYFIYLNFAFHFVIDFTTSKISSFYYSQNKIHEFFIVIGFDQMLHYLCLFVTLQYFLTL